MKSIKDISWLVTEEEYRADPALSYSIIAKYERTGFNGLSSLYERTESPSLLFGSCVDAIITGGEDEFNERYVVIEVPDVEPAIKQVLESIFYSGNYINIELCCISDKDIIRHTEIVGYQLRWKPETRAKVIREKGTEYYKALLKQGSRTLVTQSMYNDVMKSVEALKSSEATKWYFQKDNPFDGIERFYQLKFKTRIDGVDYRCMFDELIVDNKEKKIYPVDLKTSHKKEWDFYKSFVEWNYQIQNRLYARILKKIVEADDYFKDFTIENYVDIVVCKDSLTPLVWSTPFTFVEGDLVFGKQKQIIMRDPTTIGKELSYYIENNPTVPKGIYNVNNIAEWLNTL